jgi:hypothetical protein
VQKDKTMKITKNELKQIIKEELQAVLLEYNPTSTEFAPEERTTLRIAGELQDAGFGNPAAAQEVAKAIDAAVLAGISDEETLKQKALNVGGAGSTEIVAQLTNLTKKANRKRQMAMKKPAKDGLGGALGSWGRQLRRDIEKMRQTRGGVPPR